MQTDLKNTLMLLNPWWADEALSNLLPNGFVKRQQLPTLLSPEWDNRCTVLVGPRQSGKTTLGKALAYYLLEANRYTQLVYLNCDFQDIAAWVTKPEFILPLFDLLATRELIIFIDEVQRLQSPGLLLKSIIDLNLPIKLIASGSSQLELKSKIKEHLTGRKIEAKILPLSLNEIKPPSIEIESNWVLYGSYPAVIKTSEKKLVLRELYQDYIRKDIVEILKISNPQVLEKLITLLAHSSGQLINVQQLCVDCKASNSMIEHYLSVLENTYVISKVTPFVGNKRTEITSRPIYYFIDNGFRNFALENFMGLDKRVDNGLLVEGAVYQELLKYKSQHYLDYHLHFWRTKSGAEMDFVIKQGDIIISIEVKYKNFSKFSLSRSFYSFLESYKPTIAFVVTKNYRATREIDGCKVVLLPFLELVDMFNDFPDFA